MVAARRTKVASICTCGYREEQQRIQPAANGIVQKTKQLEQLKKGMRASGVNTEVVGRKMRGVRDWPGRRCNGRKRKALDKVVSFSDKIIEYFLSSRRAGEYVLLVVKAGFEDVDELDSQQLMKCSAGR